MTARDTWQTLDTDGIPSDETALTAEHRNDARVDIYHAVVRPRIYARRMVRWTQRLLYEVEQLREENTFLREQLTQIREVTSRDWTRTAPLTPEQRLLQAIYGPNWKEHAHDQPA